MTEGSFHRRIFSRARTTIWVCAFAGLIAVALLGCSLFGTKRKATDVARGRVLFETHCGGCHSGKKLDVAVPPPVLGGIFQRGFLPSGAAATNAQVRSTILTGRVGIMPSFEDTLTNRDIADIIAYLHTLKPTQPQDTSSSSS